MLEPAELAWNGRSAGGLMLSAKGSERLTRTGPGTPIGDLLDRYRQPAAASSEIAGRATLHLKILGEPLVLLKDRSGAWGPFTESCPHRDVSLADGDPTSDGIEDPQGRFVIHPAASVLIDCRAIATSGTIPRASPRVSTMAFSPIGDDLAAFLDGNAGKAVAKESAVIA